MKIRSKIPILIAVMIACISLIAFLIDRFIILEEFEKIERKATVQAISRVITLIEQEARVLDAHAKEWGWWNDTYRFVENLDEEYIRDNIAIAHISSLDIDYIFFIDARDKLVFVAAVDAKEVKPIEMSEELKEYVMKYLALFKPEELLGGTHGIVTEAKVSYIAAARNILTSKTEGPSHGTIIMARKIDESMIEHWRKLVQSDISLFPSEGHDNPPQLQSEWEEAFDKFDKHTPRPTELIITVDKEMIIADAIIDDIRGAPALAIEVKIPRTAWAHAKIAILYLLFTLIPVGIVCFIVTYLLQRKELLARVAHIDNEELKISNSKLQGLMKTQSDFTSTVSHEIRTPLGTIQQAIEMTLEEIDGPLNDKQTSRLGTARRNVDRLVRLTSDVLNFTRLETGHVEISFEATDLNHLVEDIFTLMKSAAEKKGVDLSLELPKHTVVAICDGDKIRQTLINLTHNATKFTEEGGKITISLEDTGNDAEISVSDTGVGIDASQIAKLFEPFSQIKNPFFKASEGSGLGLSICKQIVDAHDGRIDVESQPGKGTTFNIRIPKPGPTAVEQ